MVNEFVTLPLINKRTLSRVLWPSVKTANGSILHHRITGRTKWSKDDVLNLRSALTDLIQMADLVRDAIDQETVR